MTTSVTDDREKFEKWYIDEYTIPNNPPIDMKYDIRTDGSYGVPQRNTAWIAWQAALRSQGKVVKVTDLQHLLCRWDERADGMEAKGLGTAFGELGNIRTGLVSAYNSASEDLTALISKAEKV